MFVSYPKDLNKSIICEHHKAPTLEEIIHTQKFESISWVRHLKWLLVSSTPLQLSPIIIFNIHQSSYWFQRMPFSLKMSQDVCHYMDNVIRKYTGVFSIHDDDIAVYGKTEEEHGSNLFNLMKVTQENNFSSILLNVPFISPKTPFMDVSSWKMESSLTQQRFSAPLTCHLPKTSNNFRVSWAW